MNNEQLQMMETILKQQEEILERQNIIMSQLNEMNERLNSSDNNNRYQIDELKSMISQLLYR